jgi:hypothetical protein
MTVNLLAELTLFLALIKIQLKDSNLKQNQIINQLLKQYETSI